MTPDRTILDALRRRLDTAPDAPFAHVVEGERITTLTIAELVAQAARWAGLLAAGGGPGDPVVIMLRHGPALYPAFLGCVMAGRVPTFLPPPSPKQDPALFWRDHTALLRRIAAADVITDAETAALLPPGPWRPHLPAAAASVPAAAPPLAAWHAAAGGDVALLQHSSGTTGLKKGVALSHAAILAQVDAYAAAIGFAAGDVVASWLPLYHDMGLVTGFLLPLLRGGAVLSLDAFAWVARPETLLAGIEARCARWVWLPNFAFAHLALTRRPGASYDLSSVRAFINCSEMCRAETFDLFAATFADCGVTPGQLQTCYAMAETVFAVTQTPPGRVVPREASRLSVGRPIAGLAVRILDETDAAVPDGTIGQVAVAGDCVFAGYHRQPAATAAAFAGPWYRTGDLGVLRDGALTITGRAKDVIILGGRSFHAPDIEAVAQDVAGILPGRVVALGVPDAATGTEALVVVAETRLPAADHPGLRRALRAAIEAALGLGGTVAALREPGWLVKTTSGKLSRAENLAKYHVEIAGPPA